MSIGKKGHRNGGKFVNHTTIIETASHVLDHAALMEEVKRISPGVIRPTDQGAHGKFRVKFADIVGGLLLTIRGNNAAQEVRVYTSDPNKTRTELCRYCLSKGISIAFLKKESPVLVK